MVCFIVMLINLKFSSLFLPTSSTKRRPSVCYKFVKNSILRFFYNEKNCNKFNFCCKKQYGLRKWINCYFYWLSRKYCPCNYILYLMAGQYLLYNWVKLNNKYCVWWNYTEKIKAKANFLHILCCQTTYLVNFTIEYNFYYLESKFWTITIF